MNKILIFFVLTLISVQGYSSEVTEYFKDLRRLSMKIKGVPPSNEEFQALLQSYHVKEVESFFDKKTKEYLASPSHTAKLTERLEERFGFSPTELPLDLLLDSGLALETERFKAGISKNFRTANDLFRRLSLENLSWDSLLTAPTLNVYQDEISGSNFESIKSSTFYSFLNPHLPDLQIQKPNLSGADTLFQEKSFVPSYVFYNYVPTELGLIYSPIFTLKTEDYNQVLAGALTSPRFFSRYRNTAVNKNRKRAAAVFRIFLCDTMSPAIFFSDSEKSKLIDLIYPDSGDELGSQMPTHHPMLLSQNNEKKHGTNPECMSCHYKLDPLAQAFNSISVALPKEPRSGALVYKKKDGALVELYGHGLGEVARHIISTEEYAQCQVQTLKDWFWGEELVLTPLKQNELISQFNELGRKTQDFIYYLVRQPEFYGKKNNELNPNIQSYVKAQNAFGQCMSCHGNLKDSVNLLQIPFGGTKKSHENWINKIITELDIKNNGINPSMPPRNANWSSAQFLHVNKAIVEWICRGAPNEKGESTIESRLVDASCEGVSK